MRRLVQVDGHDVVALPQERTDGLVAELAAIGGGADDGDAAGVGWRGHRGGGPLGPIYNRQVVRRATLLLLLLCSVTFLAGLGRPAIGDSDEAFYAEAAREMRERGDWLTPYYNYETRFQKPVLYYWLIGGTYAVAGIGEAQARLWAALSGVGLALVTAAAGRRWRDEADGPAGRRHRRDQLRVLFDRTAVAARPAAGLLRDAHRVCDAGRHARRPSARHALAGAGRSRRRRARF